MVSLMDIQMEVVRKFEEFRKDFIEHARKIKEIALEIFGDANVYVFGSVVRGECHPMSDVDVAVVVSKDICEEERINFYRKIRKEFGILHPFEIHILSRKEWRVYEKFTKNSIKI